MISLPSPYALFKPSLGLEPAGWRPYHECERKVWVGWFFQEGAGGRAYPFKNPGVYPGAGLTGTDMDVRAKSVPLWIESPYGRAIQFDGTDDAAFVRPGLGGKNKISIEAIARWDSFSNNDDMLLEYTDNYNTQSGGFILLPNSSGGGGAPSGVFATNYHNGSGGYNGGYFTRPSAGWHHYVFTLDLTVGTGMCFAAYVDGVAQSMTQVFSTNITTTLATNSGATIAGFGVFYRYTGLGSLFGAGALAKLVVYDGILSASEVRALSREPYASLRPRAPRFWHFRPVTVVVPHMIFQYRQRRV